MNKTTLAIVLILTLCVSMSLLAILTQTGDSSIKYDIDIIYDTTYADPNFDPRSSFDDEILDALRDAGPETRIDYDPRTSTVTIPDMDAVSEAPVFTP